MTVRRMFSVILVVAAVVVTGQFLLPRQSVAEEPKRFSSVQQLAEYIKANSLLAQMGGGREGLAVGMPAAPTARPAELKAADSGAQAMSNDSYSATNVQVEGVDESDILKNDGKYLYVAAGGQVHILDAYPAEKARLLSSIKCYGYPWGIFIKGDRLAIISVKGKGDTPPLYEHKSGVVGGMSPKFSAPGMLMSVYDVADRSKPVEVKTLAWEGSLVTSRMIGDYAYLVLNMPVIFDGDNVKLPRLTEDGRVMEVPPTEIFFFDYPDYSYNFTMVVAVNIAGGKQQFSGRTFLTGASQTVYASLENLYLAGAKALDMASLTGKFIDGLASLVEGEVADRIRDIGSASVSPDQKMVRAEQVLESYLSGLDYAAAAVLEEKIGQLRERFRRDIERERNKTVIYKFFLQESGIEYRSRGEVNGQLLNQFSMDEDGGYFRVATTSQGFLLSDRPVTRNNIYVMDRDLNVVGRLEGLAPTERIYSARFMGSRVYLVTFRNIDPLFVIDLKNPEDPRVLGELKIPGFSDYLHPYDENHLIGVGKEMAPIPQPVPLPQPLPLKPGNPVPAPEFVPPLPVRQQGVKIALFDVSNPARPVEVSKYVVENLYSDSEVSRNHKAFLFSRARNLMALPVSYAEYPSVMSGEKGILPRYKYWQGMYVFNISLTDGIKLKGKIDHPAEKAVYETADPVRRAAYINDVFYTVSDGAVKMSAIDSLKEIRIVRLPREENPPNIIKERGHTSSF